MKSGILKQNKHNTYQTILSQLQNHNLNLFLTVGTALIISSAMLLLIFTSKTFLNDFNNAVIKLNEESIMEQTERHLIETTSIHVKKYSAIFQQAEILSATIASEAVSILHHLDDYSALTLNQDQELTLFPNGFYSNNASEKVSLIVPQNYKNKIKLRKQMSAFCHLDSLLVQVVSTNPMYYADYMVTEDGLSKYFPNTHYVSKLPSIDSYDFKKDQYYLTATPAKNPKGKTQWSRVGADITGKGLMIAVVSPLYLSDGTFKGVAGIDITLDTVINGILTQETHGENIYGCRKAFHFLVDKDLNVIAIPFDRMRAFGFNDAGSKKLKAGDLLSLNMLDSNRGEIRNIAKKMTSTKSGILRVNFENDIHIIAYQNIPETGWILGAAVPEHDLLAPIRATRKVFEKTYSTMSVRLVLIAIFFLCLSIAGTVMLLRTQLLEPIRQIISFTKKFSRGKLDERIYPVNKGEIGELESALNHMAEGLQKSTVSIDMLEEANRKLEILSNIDALTTLYNRRYFELHIDKEWKRLERSGLPLSLLICDIDYFKLYNDTYGHPAGDNCIILVAKAIKSHCSRASDIPSRYGGEEFAVILPQTDADMACRIANLIREEIDGYEIPHENSIIRKTVSISIGAATLIPTNSERPEYLISLADKALYDSKKNGRNRITCLSFKS